MITQANPLGTNQQKFNERAILLAKGQKDKQDLCKDMSKTTSIIPFFFVTKRCLRVQTIVLSNGTKK